MIRWLAASMAVAMACAKPHATPGAFSVLVEMPPDGSINNPPSATNVAATFSAAIDCSRVSDASLQVLVAGAPLSGHVTCSSTTLAFTASDSMPTQAMVEVVVDAHVADESGQELGSATSWMFTTGLWTVQLGTSSDDQAAGIAVDKSDHVYVVGSTAGDFDGNTSAGPPDAFVLALAASGARRWSAQLGTAAADGASGVALDAQGSVFVVGYTGGALAGNTSAGGIDAFVAMYDASGAQQWVRQLGSEGNDYATAVAVDESGEIYVVGYTDDAVSGTSAGLEDMFVAKYNAEGTQQWIQQYGATGRDYATSAAIDASGHVIVAGYTDGGLDGHSNAGYDDMFLVSFDSNGFRIFTRQWGTSGYDVARAVATDAKGNEIIAGYTNGAGVTGMSAGGFDTMVILYSGGVDQWYRQLGTAGDDNAYGIAIDGSEHVDIVGSTTGAFDGNSNAGSADLFVVQYDIAGKLNWTRQLGSSGSDQATCVAVDPGGNLFVGGKTDGGLDGNTSTGGEDMFVVQYGPDGTEH